MSESTTVLVTEEAITVIGTVPIGPQGPPGVITADDVVDLFTGTPDGTLFLRDDGTLAAPEGSADAPADATYLVTTAHADLSGEVVVGATPGGELGGTWAAPTVDATHSGSSHAAVQAAAEATAAADATAKVAAEAALARNADNLTSGTVADARIPATIARDAEVAAAYQPLDADLTALAAAGNSAVLAATTASFLTADETKLDGIEAGADVTDAANVAAAGAAMLATGGTFAADIAVPDEAYDATAWNGSLEVPTKNAVRDKIETLGGGAPSGPAGGVLSGTYPDPGFAADMATQAELDLYAPLAGAQFTAASPITVVDRTAGVLIQPPTSNEEVNGLVIRAPDATWGVSQDYGEGQALIVAKSTGNIGDSSSSGALMARIDRDGYIGTVAGIHVASGSRAAVGVTPTYGIQVQPSLVGVNLVELAPPASATGRAVKLYSPGTGSERWYLDPNGVIVGLADDFATASYYIAPASAGFGTVRALFNAINAGVIPLYLKGAASQTADLLQVNSSTPTLLARFNKDGYLGLRKTAAPADGDVATSEVMFWWDNTSGTPTLRLKGKDSAGTVANRTVVTTTEGVLLTGAQSVAGVKTFTSDPIIPDEAYGAGWDGSLEPPTKNAVYDQIETETTELATAIADGDASTLTSAQSYADGKVSDAAYGAGWNGDTTHAPSKNAVYDKIETLGGSSANLATIYAFGG